MATDSDHVDRASSWLRAEATTPALVVDEDVLLRNLDEMATLCERNGVELLPHAKTHRMAEVGLLQVSRGAVGLCVAKLGEAERFADAGVQRLFVAYPLVGTDKAARALALHRRCRLTVGTDSVTAARSIGEVFAEAGETVDVMLAIDTGLGREGVPADSAPKIAHALAQEPGIRLCGIYTHEGTTYGAPSEMALQEAALAAARTMTALADTIRAQGVPIEHVSLGASASARVAVEVNGVTQIRPGIYAFNDVGQIALGLATLATTALRVIATVVSHPEPARACIDAGSKSLSTDLVPAIAHRSSYPGHGLIVNAPGWSIERMSEEHGWLKWSGPGEPSPLPVGSRLEIVPNHACMAFAGLRKAHVLRGGELRTVWNGFGPGASE